LGGDSLNILVAVPKMIGGFLYDSYELQ